MKTLAAVQKKLDELKKENRRVVEIKRDIIRHKFILCTGCRKKSLLFSWIFIQNTYYVAPDSCTGGDYWLHSETKCCHIICPKCDKKLYLYNHPQRDAIIGLIDSHEFFKKDLFREVREEGNK